MHAPHAAVFDLDGVIVDTAPLHFAAWRQTAAELGFTLADEHEALLKGVGRAEALEVVLGIGGVEVSPERAATLAHEKNERYVASLSELSASDVLPGARETLAHLREAGIPVALGSASRNAKPVLNRLNLTQAFDAIVDGTDLTASKPDPQVFTLAAERLGVEPGACVVFEDAVAGIAAARAAGMKAVGIGAPEALEGADAVIPGLDRFSDLPGHLTPVGSGGEAASAHDADRLHGVALGAAPFNLDVTAQAWVRDTLAELTPKERLGQLFCLLAEPGTPEQVEADFAVVEPGGYMRRPSMSHDIVSLNRTIQERASVPLLLAANLEAGANGVAFDATSVGSPLQAAATGDPESSRRMGEVCAVQGRALGINWGFSPIIDIQMNWRNPIVLTRGFGSDPETVATHGEQFVRGLQDNGVAASIKHWPGDGVDDRDQHLLTTVNTLTTHEWDATFGAVYQRAIDAGALTVMAAHISLPHYSRALRPGIADEDILPASLAPEITRDLLRGQLGFEGVVVTDATLMAGMQMSMPRAQAVPQSIAAGCDMFLFTEDYATDLAHLERGVESGLVTTDRINEAVTRVLALKAALNLDDRDHTLETMTGDITGPTRGQHEGWAHEQAQRAVTLVKDKEAGLLPLNAQTRPRVLLYSLRGGALPSTGPAERLRDGLAKRGFDAQLHADPEPHETLFKAVGRDGAVTGADLTENFDAVIYVADIPPASNFHTARPNWTFWTAANLPRYTHTVPTIFVSLGNPFHLQDVPRVKTFINAYGNNDATVQAVAAALTGEIPFAGTSPVDPMCGYWEAAL